MRSEKKLYVQTFFKDQHLSKKLETKGLDTVRVLDFKITLQNQKECIIFLKKF